MSKNKSKLVAAERILCSQGFGTRKECGKLIHLGLVKFNQVQVNHPRDEFEIQNLGMDVDGVVDEYRDHIYIVMNKPANVECSRKSYMHTTVFNILPQHYVTRGVQNAGRLDTGTTGVICFSDDGQFIHHIISPKKKLEKQYHATLDQTPPSDFISKLLEGVFLEKEDVWVKAVDAQMKSEKELSITLHEGKYHQVKRMVLLAGSEVIALERVRVGGLKIENIPERGTWRHLSEEEIKGCLGYEGLL